MREFKFVHWRWQVLAASSTHGWSVTVTHVVAAATAQAGSSAGTKISQVTVTTTSSSERLVFTRSSFPPSQDTRSALAVIVENKGSVSTLSVPGAGLFLTVTQLSDNNGGNLLVGIVGEPDSGILVFGCGAQGQQVPTPSIIDSRCDSVGTSVDFKRVRACSSLPVITVT
jgi:hypothetical protein